MRLATAVAIAGILFPIGSLAQDAAPPLVEAPQAPPLEQPYSRPCQDSAVTDSCVIAVSIGAVVGVITVNALTGGLLSPILLVGTDAGGVAGTSILAGLFVAHWGVEMAVIGSGSAAAVTTGAADSWLTTISDAYTSAETYVLSVGSDVSTAVGNWLNAW